MTFLVIEAVFKAAFSWQSKGNASLFRLGMIVGLIFRIVIGLVAWLLVRGGLTGDNPELLASMEAGK